jgi:hypothetical protein
MGLLPFAPNLEKHLLREGYLEVIFDNCIDLHDVLQGAAVTHYNVSVDGNLHGRYGIFFQGDLPLRRMYIQSPGSQPVLLAYGLTPEELEQLFNMQPANTYEFVLGKMRRLDSHTEIPFP